MIDEQSTSATETQLVCRTGGF